MKEVRVLKYQACYPGLNKKLSVVNPKAYRHALIHIRITELQGKGMRMQKTGKPNPRGTNITFVPVKSAEEYQFELERIISDVKEISIEFEKVKN